VNVVTFAWIFGQ